MARITRALQKIFALNNDASTNFGNGQFGSGKLGTKVITNDIEELQELSAYNAGWKDAVLVNSAGNPNLPPLEEFQALDYICTYQIAYIFQEGIPEFNVDTTYYENSVAKLSGTYELYGSNVDNNIGNTPGVDPEWDLLLDLSKAVYTDNSASVDNELTLWDGAGGRKTKRATSFTGYPVLAAGVLTVNNAATTFNAIKQAATTSTTGVLEISTGAEAQSKSGNTALVASNLADIEYISSQQSITFGGTITLNHGLGVVPRSLYVQLVNLTAEFGYSPGDIAELHQNTNDTGGNISGMAVKFTSTQLQMRYGTQLQVVNFTDGQAAVITAASWQAIFIARI